MQGGKWLSIKSTPSKQLKSLNSAKFYQPKDIIRLMNLSINIDNTPVKLNGSELTKTNDLDNTTTVNPDNDVIDSSIETQLQPQTLTEDQRRVQQKKLSLMRDKAELSYQITSLKDLNQYKNHGIKVKRNNNKKTITGELVSIDDTTFSIETTEYGGIAVFKISKSDVIELQVYR